MKKKLALMLVLILAVGGAAFAGPIIGVGFAPAVGQNATVHFGWQSDDWAIIVSRDSLSTWLGNWGFGAYWTPTLWSSYTNLRSGLTLNFKWNKNSITYNGLSVVVGGEKWFSDQFGVYGQLDISSNLAITPEIGVEINFTPPKPQTPSG